MSAEAHSSQDWYRLREARPRLRRDVRVIRHIYLGRPWYVLSDRTGTKVHRLTPAAQDVAGRLDGSRSVGDIWEDVVARMGEDAPTQDEVVRLLSQLHSSDLLEDSETPLLSDALERRDKERTQKWKKIFLNPLSITLPLVDPDRFLQWLARVMGILPSGLWWGMAAAIIGAALIMLPLHWAALTARGLEGFLDLENLALIALIYPAVKAVHEIGHGVVTRSRGGEVHEMGLMFIAFYPIPYVEASSSLSFPSKWDRAAVAAAGVVVELVIASVAFFLWMQAEPGLVRALMFNTMVISGLSTLAVNGNPLLKFDGYHVMCDVIEIPNLAKRGNEWWGEMARVHILRTGERRRERMVTTGWERLWFTLYPPAHFVYRIFISLTIALFVAATYRLVGVVLAIWSVCLMVLWPAVKTAHKAVTDGRIRRAGGRAVVGAASIVAALLIVLCIIPVPHVALVQGVTWLPEEAILRAPQPGRLAALHTRDGAQVKIDAAIATLDAPELVARARVREARLARAQAAYDAALVGDRARAAELRTQLDEARAGLTAAAARVAELEVRTGLAGRFDIPGTLDPLGRFYDRGEIIGYVLPDAAPVIRVVVPQDLAALIRSELTGIELRFADDLGLVHAARILRVVPAGEDRLPSPVLSIEGGGPFATVPGDEDPLRAATRLFQLDLELVEPEVRPAFGLRAHVRMHFSEKPLITRAARAMRALFLSRFDV